MDCSPLPSEKRPTGKQKEEEEKKDEIGKVEGKRSKIRGVQKNEIQCREKGKELSKECYRKRRKNRTKKAKYYKG